MTHGEHAPVQRNDLVVDTAPRALFLPDLVQSQHLQLFYGDLHNHTGYSDGTGRPEDALRQMRARGLHFAAITDHAEFFDRETSLHNPKNWAALAEQVKALTTDDFLAIRGFEWSSPSQGHSNVWWSSGYTGYFRTGDETMDEYYHWLEQAEAIPGASVLAGFNHPGREVACFDGCTYVPALEDRIVTLECFNRDDDYGDVFFRALDHGWHVGAIGVSDHHGNDWGSPHLPRAGLLASVLTPAGLQSALQNRRVFATRSPSLALLVAGNGSLMGSRLALRKGELPEIGVWCDDPAANGDWSRLELWTNGGTLVEARETRGLQQISWSLTPSPVDGVENWYVIRIQRRGAPVAYSSPIWVSVGGSQ
jgi:hypothetical protein